MCFHHSTGLHLGDGWKFLFTNTTIFFIKETCKFLSKKTVARLYSKNSSGEELWCVAMPCPRKAVPDLVTHRSPGLSLKSSHWGESRALLFPQLLLTHCRIPPVLLWFCMLCCSPVLTSQTVGGRSSKKREGWTDRQRRHYNFSKVNHPYHAFSDTENYLFFKMKIKHTLCCTCWVYLA